MSKRAQYYLSPFSSFLPAPQHPPHAAFREGGREDSGGSCGSQVPTSHLPPKCTPTGRAGGAAPLPVQDTLSRLSPLSPPPPSYPSQLSEGQFWGGRVLCCPCLEDLALAEVARKGWNFLVLGGCHSMLQPPTLGAPEMAMLNTPPRQALPLSSAPTAAPRAGDFLW